MKRAYRRARGAAEWNEAAPTSKERHANRQNAL